VLAVTEVDGVVVKVYKLTDEGIVGVDGVVGVGSE
jgi:hypothetical protein